MKRNDLSKLEIGILWISMMMLLYSLVEMLW